MTSDHDFQQRILEVHIADADVSKHVTLLLNMVMEVVMTYENEVKAGDSPASHILTFK